MPKSKTDVTCEALLDDIAELKTQIAAKAALLDEKQRQYAAARARRAAETKQWSFADSQRHYRESLAKQANN